MLLIVDIYNADKSILNFLVLYNVLWKLEKLYVLSVVLVVA